MATTDTSEKGLEALIVRYLTGQTTPPTVQPNTVQQTRALYAVGGYEPGRPSDYNRDCALDVAKLLAFLQTTQPDVCQMLELNREGIRRSQFLHRLQGEITKRGVVDVMRKGVKDGPAHVDLYHFLPTPGNASAAAKFNKNIFSITRQLHYSNDKTAKSLDLVLFINGLPIATFELKNSLTKQTVADAIIQYKNDRDPRELLFQLGRCIAHFAVDDNEVAFCTHLSGKSSWFLPFNQGWNSGAGNPPNPDGLKTDYLWKRILARESLANLIENFAQIIQETDDKNKKKRKQVFPRFHQLATVRALLRRCQAEGVGQRYLIQHSAGSGKSNTIAWLAYQLAELPLANDPKNPQFHSIVVITDRRALDTQISATIKSYDHVASIFGHSESAEELRGFLRQGKKIIVTTVQKFPFILDELGDLGSRRFALLIDEAHSGQGGKTSAKMHLALAATDKPASGAGPAIADGSDASEEEYEAEAEDGTVKPTTEDIINDLIKKRKMLPNASYFAFTATPKNKTLELFGERYEEGGKAYFRSPPELTYTTKQAIEEGFILDVVKHYTPVASFYHVAKTVEGDPAFDKIKALKKIRRYVESHEKAIRQKAEIMVDHFLAEVMAKHKIGGKARAMVVCNGVARAADYYRQISDYLNSLNSPYKAIVAFSGDTEVGGKKLTETDLNGFAGKDIPAKLRQDPYRFLIVANKFVTGFDEPLLHTMYVDKPLAGVLAVQTLSRLNRAHPQKYDTFVLDFADNQAAVQQAFQDYYRATVQVGETDPNKLHDLKHDLDQHQVYAWAQVEALVSAYVHGAERDRLDPILDACVGVYVTTLDEAQQVSFKGKAKSFVRSYGFLSAILTFGYAEWEKLATFLNFLIPKLPAPKEEDLSKGVLETIDMDSYRPEVLATLRMAMEEQDGMVEPAPTAGNGLSRDAELEKLSVIIKEFNDLFGNIPWKDPEKILHAITEEIPQRVMREQKYQNAIVHSDEQAARMEHDIVLHRAVNELLTDYTELFKQFSTNQDFKRWLSNSVFHVTYHPDQAKSAVALQALKVRALAILSASFGDAPIWSHAATALFAQMERGSGGKTRDYLGLGDLAAVEAEHGLSVANILFPVLNLLSANDVGLFRREFVDGTDIREPATLSFDEVQGRAWAADGDDDLRWAEKISVRWAVNKKMDGSNAQKE